MSRVRKVLANSKGFVDIQSVMVGVIITAIVAGIALVSVVGFTRMINDDNAKTTAKTLAVAMEGYYTDNDMYPKYQTRVVGGVTQEYTALQQLIDKKYVTAGYGKIPSGELCIKRDNASAFPQSYVAALKSQTGKYFVVTEASGTPIETRDVSRTCFA